MTQTYIDTTVLRAFLILNSTAPGVQANRQAHAVAQARQIIEDLKRRAKGDPNERYVLMRTQEVEYQIFLEEEEMRRIAAERNILVANDLVRQYNAEVGKHRPDFATLRGLWRRMAEVDVRIANNLADSYNRRYRQISRESLHSLERALTTNDHTLARRELEYLEKNRNYLMIAASQLEAQRQRFERIVGATSEYQRIATELERGERAFAENRLSESRTSLTMVQNRIREIRAHIPERDANNVTARAARTMRALDAREDSLVNLALEVLNKQGPDAAVEYFDEVLQKRMNISRERAAIVDQAIMRARPEQATVRESGVQMVVHDPNDSNRESLSLVQDRALLRAQERADSLRVVRARAEDIGTNIQTLISNRRPKDAERLFNREKAFLSSVMNSGDFRALELSVRQGSRAAGGTNVNRNRQRADQHTAEIYALIENNRVRDAHKRFRKNRKHLERHLDRESFQMLEMTVTQSFNSMAKRR
jgi:hypothetical protein